MLQLAVKKNQDDILHEQMDQCKSVEGKARVYVEERLINFGVRSLEELDFTILSKYRFYVLNDNGLSSKQKQRYYSYPESFLVSFYADSCPVIKSEVLEDTTLGSAAERNKVAAFLFLSGVEYINELSYGLRCQFKNYLSMPTIYSRINSTLKVFDQIKLKSIELDNKRNPFKKNELSYKNQEVFLVYYPDAVKAREFYYSQDKEILIYNLINAPEKLGKQTVDMLNWFVREFSDKKIRHDLYLRPFHRFFSFCMENGIEDFEEITYSQYNQFVESIIGQVGTKEREFKQIVNTILRHLFCHDDSIRWEVDNWYLERFTFKNYRSNPAYPVSRFRFWEISTELNKRYMKEYIKYCLSVTEMSVDNIRGKYLEIKEFLLFFDYKGWKLNELSPEMMEEYCCNLDQKDIKPETFNKKIKAIFGLIHYLITRELIVPVKVHCAFYLKKSFVNHNNYSISAENHNKLVKELINAPLHIKMMELVLSQTGRRICEVCCATPYSFFELNGKYYWKIIQYKMRREVVIPIPRNLYLTVWGYIKEEGIEHEDFIFRKRDGRPYDPNYLRKQLKKYADKAGIKNFRPHGYRHTVATKLYKKGTRLQAIREYLGHRSDEMTKQYIDYVESIIEAKSRSLFSGRNAK